MKRLTASSDRLRVGPLREGAFHSRLHDERTAALLGIALGVTFLIAFLTGLLSHLIQQPPAWFVWPARPAGLYRITQGLHVATGLASIPLLFAKLWTVYPRLWTWPPVESVMHAVERVALFPLVGGSIFLLFSGVANIGLWYPWSFFFPAGHYWGSWITMGALVVHIGAKATLTRRAVMSAGLDIADLPGEGLSRRGFLGVVAATSGLITLTTIGQTWRPLNFLAVLAPRRPDVGPQGFPVNKSAASARVGRAAMSPDYALRIDGDVATPLSLSLEDLRALPQREATLPITCVEGWSADVMWKGVQLSLLLEMAGAGAGSVVSVTSLQESGLYKASEIIGAHVTDPDTLIALEANGSPLHLDHGFPARLIAPSRPGVLQTKWLKTLTVHSA